MVIIIISIVVLLLIVGAVVLFLMMKGKDGGSKASSEESEEAPSPPPKVTPPPPSAPPTTPPSDASAASLSGGSGSEAAKASGQYHMHENINLHRYFQTTNSSDRVTDPKSCESYCNNSATCAGFYYENNVCKYMHMNPAGKDYSVNLLTTSSNGNRTYSTFKYMDLFTTRNPVVATSNNSGVATENKGLDEGMCKMECNSITKSGQCFGYTYNEYFDNSNALHKTCRFINHVLDPSGNSGSGWGLGKTYIKKTS